MKFDPNKQSNGGYVWATFIPNRKPKFKLHSNLAQATSALKYRSHYVDSDYRYEYVPDDCTLWQLVDGEWAEVQFKRMYNSKLGEKLL